MCLNRIDRGEREREIKFLRMTLVRCLSEWRLQIEACSSSFHIGIYYPHRNRWFGCPYTKYTCPGTPTWQYGFSSLEKCWGQVFMIYAHDKGLGDVIEEHDDVMLYYHQEGSWVSQNRFYRTRKDLCLGYYYPPAAYKYDRCPREMCTVWQQ